MLSVVDSYDSITSDRSYRKARTIPLALQEMDREVGTKFDPQIYAIFRRMITGNDG